MKKPLVFVICLFFSPVIAYAGNQKSGDWVDSSSIEHQNEEISVFNQLYHSLAVINYFGKSEYGSLKEFIRERVV